MEQLLIWFLNKLSARRRRTRPGDHLVLGVSAERDALTPFVVFPESLRVQHLGIVGLSGTGKTYLIEHMIRQDIRRGLGFAVFDVHGDLADHLVAYLAERTPLQPDILERTVIIEPFDPERSVGFNPLERTEHTSAFLQAHEFARMLRARWDRDKRGPRTEEVLFNALFALSANDRTLLDLPRLLTRPDFRSRLVARLEPGEVKDYFVERFDKLSDKMQSAIREPVLTRTRVLLENPVLRDMLGQAESTFSFRQAIEQRLFVIINLSKGKLGAENSSLLGSLLFARLALDIMSLAHTPEEARTFFSVYADEVQNLASETFGQLIAEARKYRVAVVAGHQFWRQLTPSFRQAMLAMGSKLFFRLHYQDALTLAAEISPAEQHRYVRQLTTLERGSALVRLGTERPAIITVPDHPAAVPTREDLFKLRQESARRYTRARSEIRRPRDAASDGQSPPSSERGNEIVNSPRL